MTTVVDGEIVGGNGEDKIALTGVDKIALSVVATIAVIIVLINLGTGFYQVKPGEAAALQTFGAARPEPESSEGLHWHWPSPVGRTTVIQVQKSRTSVVGLLQLT